MARVRDPGVRTLLLERAAHMLRTRQPITLRSLVEGTGVSTMAVYTHFGGMDGVWSALRQEGFTRLAARLDAMTPARDPVQELTELVAAYVANAVEHPDLFGVMFDAGFDLEDDDAAAETLEFLVRAAERSRAAGRFARSTDPRVLATHSWVVAHGLVSLVNGRTLSRRNLADGVPLLTALYVAAGDEPTRCRRSVRAGWSGEG